MILGISEIICTTGGAQGCAQGADLRGSEGVNYISEFCLFLVPMFQKQVGGCNEYPNEQCAVSGPVREVRRVMPQF